MKRIRVELFKSLNIAHWFVKVVIFPKPRGFYKMMNEDIYLSGKVNSSKNQDLDMDLSLDSKIKDIEKSYRITYQ